MSKSLDELTENELSVALAAAVGLGIKETAAWLDRSPDTVASWQKNLLRKTASRSITQAVAKVMRRRLGLQDDRAGQTVRKHRNARQVRAARARTAIAEGADPLLALSLVLWPPEGYDP